MKTYPVGVLRTCSKSPIVMTNVHIMTKPIAPFTAAVQIMANGRVLDASWSSSLMCVAESGPIKEKVKKTSDAGLQN